MRVAVDQRDLVEGARQGDQDAFAALVGASVARLEASAWRRSPHEGLRPCRD
jgi:hypothetical protein